MAKITQQKLEAHLMGSANILRGRTAGQDYKTYILTLMFFKRLSDQWDYEAEENIARLEAERGQPFSESQRRALMTNASIHRFAIPDGCRWSEVLEISDGIGQKLTEAQRGIAAANPELSGVFTVDWNQPAPDGQGTLIPQPVIHALVQHFNELNLSNANVQPDILGRAYEYLIKYFADDAGAKAGEFFTPPEVVDALIRILEPQPGETVYDPTCGSGGMLIHSADFLKEQGHRPEQIRYFGQEMNWQTYAIARINLILHGLEGFVKGGKSTLTDPLHLRPDGSIEQFDVVIANFPFSDEAWWLPEDKRTDEEKKKAKKQMDKNGFEDPYGRFSFGTPPASNGDFAFIQHIIASAKDRDASGQAGRCGVVCPQGVLFRGQPEIEEETGEFKPDGTPKMRRRKADDEYLIRRGLLDAGLVDAVIGLPLNIFYGAGVPACLLILNKNRPAERQGKVLFLYAARHFRELSNKNQLRPQDVMRLLVHYHAYGDAEHAAQLVESHAKRLRDVVTQTEHEDSERTRAEYSEWAEKLAEAQRQIAAVDEQIVGITSHMSTHVAVASSDGAQSTLNGTAPASLFPALSAAKPAKAIKATRKSKPEFDRISLEKTRAKLQKACEAPAKKIAERDERLASIAKRAEEDRQAIHATGEELRALYADPAELAKHTRVVEMSEIEENEHNLNIPRYVDTFEPEEPIDVNVALRDLEAAETARRQAESCLRLLLSEVGYALDAIA